jgi:23S rRNA (cytidine1920-2'-O)/16S rRNA (cytidine1409-2'-O)-methyltransferase
MTKMRLDQALVARGLVATRSQAESYIKLGEVQVAGEVVTKPGFFVRDDAEVVLTANEQYVSRAALKLASVAAILHVDFNGKIVLDVGSSTGGFTDYALRHGAKKVIDVEVGTDQLHPKLRGDSRIELHEQTDVRSLQLQGQEASVKSKNSKTVYIECPDIIIIDVSFISLREIIPHVSELMTRDSQLIAMVKPQFEAASSAFKHKGVIKNDRMRRDILKDFEAWATKHCVIIDKADSGVTGAKGNQERFYNLRKKINA